MSEMKASLGEFIAKVKGTGLPNTSHFFITIPNQDKITLALCDSINVPGVNIMTGDVRMYGELHEIPHSPLYAPVSASFIVDNKLSTVNLIKSWMKEVYDFETRQPGYYDSYTKNVDIFITDKVGNVISQTRLYECYPKAMQDIQLDYSQESVIKFNVQFVYKWHEKIEVTASGSPVQNVITESAQRISGMGSTEAATYVSGLPVMAAPRSELQGVITQVTGNVPISNIMNPNTVFQTASRATGIEQFGLNTSDVFSRVFNQAVNVVRSIAISKLPGPAQTLFVTAFITLGRDTRQLSATIASLGLAYATPRPGTTVQSNVLDKKVPIADAILNLITALTNLQSAFQEIQIPFTFPSADFTALSNSIRNTNSLSEFSSLMNNFGSLMSNTGSAINVAKSKVSPDLQGDFTNSLNNMANAILQAGTDIKNMSTVMG